MKNILKIIGKNLFAGFIFVVGIILTGILFVYASNLSNVNNGETLTADTLNGIIDKVNELSSGINNSTIPIGAIIPFNSSSCPTGWIKADGQNGTPDLRGEFIRGWDDGKGTDSGRVIGSWQEDTLQDHTHNYGAQHTDNGNGQGYGLLNFASYALYVDNWSVSSQYRKSNETRPRNVALLYCVKQ